MVSTKNITIRANNIGRDVTLMFTFEAPPGTGRYKDYFPLAWRVAYFPAQGNQQIDLNYGAQPAFAQVQVNRNFVSPEAWTKCDPGQSTTLRAQAGEFSWESPVKTGGEVSKAINGTTNAQDIGAGFAREGARKPDTVLVFRYVSTMHKIVTQIGALLKVYATDNYGETQIIPAEIESLQPIKEIDMIDDRVPTEYELTYDGASDTFKLSPL